MKKVYSLKKEILFKNNIYDILSIAIDKKFSLDGYAIKGQFKINGEYLIRENERDEFDIDLPYLNYIEDIYDVSKIKVDIDDFYYEIKDSNKLVISIDIAVDGLVEKVEDRCVDDIVQELDEMLKEDEDSSSIAEIRDIDTQELNDEIENLSTHEEISNNNVMNEEIIKINEEEKRESASDKIVDTLTERDNMKNEYFEEKENKEFITYKVCIVRDGDTLESIVEKYGSTIESIKKYNVINELKVGDKIIIPYERS